MIPTAADNVEAGEWRDVQAARFTEAVSEGRPELRGRGASISWAGSHSVVAGAFAARVSPLDFLKIVVDRFEKAAQAAGASQDTTPPPQGVGT